ncbi:SDR family oxidoreductase [Lichenihabitans sp. Uapishka_5]|uniref:SDR family NAD(P)-dependent oxidoreductase n=1 Tax=Lichenihabitans sp. Uapishka_5 TaxID=3037302 RepID=UPI0029E81BA9|nr:SDR family oxidoreductase [Lichenihabitans sp. Uapishka_5]MDX7952013.1 SDR family oxidoreductase [Lichenihabitans sp. Uapishka_5]
MKIDLSGKTALVTGSTEGIGFAAAKGLAEAGAAVVVNGRTQGKTEAAAARIGGQARAVAADVADPAGFAALVEALPHVDILVSNAGIFQPADFFETDDALWDRHWQVNVMAGVRLARHYLPGMAERKWGRFIMLASESAFNIPVEMIHYGVSKTADVAVARGLAKRMAGTGVTVNSVLPGPTLSDGVGTMLKDEQARTGKSLEDVAADFVNTHRPTSIIRRAATVEEVANMIVYVASPQASATTGAALRVDGGVVDTLM